MNTHDDNIRRANEEGLNADAATQSRLWNRSNKRHKDGFRRDKFGNRLNDDGKRVDPGGRRIDTEGNLVNHEGRRVDDRGRPLDVGGARAIPKVIPRLPPMMGH